jgi:hypothetical protein
MNIVFISIYLDYLQFLFIKLYSFLHKGFAMV